MSSVLEWEFWSQLLGLAELQPSNSRRFSEAGLVEYLKAQRNRLLLHTAACSMDEAETEKEFVAMDSCLDDKTNAMVFKQLIETLKARFHYLKKITSILKINKDDKLLSLAQGNIGPGHEQKQPLEYLLDSLKEACMLYVIIRLKVQHKNKQDQEQSQNGLNCFKLKESASELQSKLSDLQNQLSWPSANTAAGLQTLIQIEGKPIESVDKTTELHDMVARHRKELQDVKDSYEQEVDKLRQTIAKANESLCLCSKENNKEIDSLMNCMENQKKKHESEKTDLIDKFDQEMEELRSMLSLVNPERNGVDKPSDHASVHQSTLREHIQELVGQVSDMTKEMRRREEQGDTLQLKYKRDVENIKATCERGFAAMEESHQKVIEDLQRKHQRELENLQEEKERLLAEETAATIAAIEAMKNAHRTELEKELDKARKASSNAENADIEEIRRQHEEELCSFQREIEVLSEQYSQKCLENAHLAQALEAERQALRQCQRENQELNAHNQELNNRLAAEITKMRSMTSEDGAGDSSTTIHGKELYELEVMLRVKESEVQYLKQEINSLKEELQAAQRDKKYATDKYKDIYTELSIVKAKAEQDLVRLREQLQLAHEELGEPPVEDVDRGGYDIMKSKSNPDILKMSAAAAKRSERTMRSKSLKEGLTAEQRLHLFENKDSKEF